MDPLPVEIYVPQNLQLGDEIVGEVPLRIRDDADELVAVSLSPASDAVSIAPAVVKPGQVFRLILKDRDSLLKDFSILSIGVYSGNIQEVPLRFILDNDDGNTTLRFEKESYDLKLSTPLLEKEIALIKMTNVAPSWVRFALTGALSQHFSAYSEGGVVVVTSIPCLDCVIDIPKQFSILLTYMGAEQRSTLLNFNVENTHRLRFDYSYDAEIEEGAAHFKRVIKLKATGGKATYSLDDPSGLFSIHPKTGMLMVQHPEFVFIDTVGELLTLNATATDGEQKAKTTINIRVRPKSEIKGFSFEKDEYKLTILPGQHVADGLLSFNGNNTTNLTYRLSEGPQDLFEISGGMLFFIGKYPKEDERFMLLVLAETKQTAAITKVDVLVKGIGSKVIELKSPGSVSVVFASDEPPGPLLHVMAVVDEDEDARIEFSVSKVSARDFEGNVVDVPREAIEIVPDGKKAQIKLKSEIGDNEWLSLEAVVEAKDSAHPLERPVLCHIEVMITRSERIVKAESPLQIIEIPSSIVVPSNLPEGSFVYEIRTSPMMTNVSFSVENLSENFNLDEITGVISTNRVLRPAPSKEVLLITAKSSSQQTSKNITIDITDSKEKLPKLLQNTIMAELPVTADIGSVVANVTVVNNVPVTFDPLEGSDIFLVDSKGVIITAGNLTNDVENYILLVRVRGEGGFVDAIVNVSVDLDAARHLEFAEETYHFKVMQNILINSYVGEISLISKGMLPVKYSIHAEEGKEQLLDIDDEGRITTREEFDTVGASRRFEVTASDGMRKAHTTVEVAIIPAFDCVPEFVKGENDLFYINENTPEGAFVGKVSAKLLDQKCELSYFFWNGERSIQENSFVRIDPQTGEIKTKKTFDFEDIPSYSLVLGLKAGQRQTAEHGAILMVKDTDDHPIKFIQKTLSIEVSEATPLGSLITTARAVDPDPSQKVFYFIRQEGAEFDLNKETGEVKLAKMLDRETDDRYEFMIGASNSPDGDDIPEWMSIKLVVRDVNDNGPIFDHGHYEFLIEKMALPGRKIGKVHAVDPDLTENGDSPMVFYSLSDTQFEYRGTSRPMRGFFFVEQKTGEVLLLEPINEFVGGVFHLQVQAADGLQPSSKKSLTSLRVIVHEESDVLLSEIAKNPETLELEDVQNVTQAISNATGFRVLVKEIGYHVDEDIVLNKIADLRMVLVNRTTFEIVSAEKTMLMMKNIKRKTSSMPKVAKSQLSVFVQENSNFPSPLFLIGFVFILLLILASVIFAVILCHYRARYRREKHNFEDHRIIRNSLEEPGMCRRTTPPSPPRMPTPEEDEQMGYMSQERKMSVGPEETRTKA